MNRFLRLPVTFDVGLMKADLAICESYQWASHYNTADFSGDWKGIALRSATGKADHILATETSTYLDTPLLDECPYFREILRGFQCELETVRILLLAPGSIIKTHRDRGLTYSMGCFRLHIPIITDPEVAFVVDGEPMTMQAGECWYANFDLPHSVTHQGKTRRVHLLIDGKRNAWTDELFGKAGYDFSPENRPVQYDAKTRALMIESLKAMGTDTALRLIAGLEAQENG